MRLARVVGRVWATQKTEVLSPYKLLLVRDVNDGELFTAADTLDAGQGEMVITAGGSSAARGEGSRFIPIDASVIAIVDTKK